MVINKKGSAEPADDVQGDIGSRGDPKPLRGPPGKGICLQLLSSPDIVEQSSCSICDILLHTVTYSLVWFGVHFVCWHSILHASFAVPQVARCINRMLYQSSEQSGSACML